MPLSDCVGPPDAGAAGQTALPRSSLVVSIVDPPIVVVEPVEPAAPTTPVPRQQTVDGAAAPLGGQGAEGTPPVLGRRSTEGAAPPAKNLTGGFSIARQLGLNEGPVVDATRDVNFGSPSAILVEDRIYEILPLLS